MELTFFKEGLKWVVLLGTISFLARQRYSVLFVSLLIAKWQTALACNNFSLVQPTLAEAA